MKLLRSFIPIFILVLVTSAQAVSQTTLPGDTPNKKEIIIDTADLRMIHAEISIDREKYLVTNPTLTKYFIPDKAELGYFIASNRNAGFNIISDTLVFALYDWGNPSHSVITIWKIQGNKSRLITILDRTLTSFFGGSWIEQVHQLSENEYLLAGKTSGGDECEEGACWLGVWKLPRSFRIIWYDDYTNCPDGSNPPVDESVHTEYKYTFRYDSNKHKMMVDKYEEVRKEHGDGSYKVLNKTTETFHLDVTKLVNRDLTDVLNQIL